MNGVGESEVGKEAVVGRGSRDSSARPDPRRSQNDEMEVTTLQPPAGMARPSTQSGSRGTISASSSTNMRQGTGSMFQRRRDVPSGGRLHPLMDARIGNKRGDEVPWPQFACRWHGNVPVDGSASPTKLSW